MRSHVYVTISSLASIFTAAACATPTGDAGESLAVKCAIAETSSAITTTATTTTTLKTTTPDPPPTPPTDPTSPTDCPVCKDADGKPLPPDDCVVHDDVCKAPGNGGTDAVDVSQTLVVLEAATASPAIAYYGACDGNGGQCEDRDYAYEITGTELAVATFSNGVTTVYAIPDGAHAMRAKQPLFPVLPASAYYHNPAVHVVFLDAAGNKVEGYGDMQDDCRVDSDDSSGSSGALSPDDDVPCWCTLC